MPESYDAQYTRLLMDERDRVPAILGRILEHATAGQAMCVECATTVRDALDALTPPATWDDWVRSHGR
jgi:hypothetical protein